jgi:NTP pyrophosphatase (non-canonical NTP hydrolase)
MEVALTKQERIPYVLNTYKDMTKEMCLYKGWHKATVEQVWLYLTEEIGELAGSIRRCRNQFCDGKQTKIEDELGDVFSYMFQLAYMLNVDLDRMWQNNQIKAYSKTYGKFHQSFERRTLTSLGCNM